MRLIANIIFYTTIFVLNMTENKSIAKNVAPSDTEE